MTEHTLLIDGHNLLFRSYYGIPSAAKLKNGQQINAVYGFISTIRKLFASTSIAECIVVFDSETSTQDKLKINPEYKANRTYADPDIFRQLEVIKQILQLLGIAQIENSKYEADDIIGSLAQRADRDSIIFSKDSDFTQLVTNSISLAHNTGENFIKITPTSILETFGFHPTSYIDYLALKGDASDNIKGALGIGEKTAKILIQKYHTVEALIENLVAEPNRIKNRIQASEEIIRNNKQFLAINTQLTEYYGYVASLPNTLGAKLALSTPHYLQELGYV